MSGKWGHDGYSDTRESSLSYGRGRARLNPDREPSPSCGRGRARLGRGNQLASRDHLKPGGDKESPYVTDERPNIKKDVEGTRSKKKRPEVQVYVPRHRRMQEQTEDNISKDEQIPKEKSNVFREEQNSSSLSSPNELGRPSKKPKTVSQVYIPRAKRQQLEEESKQSPVQAAAPHTHTEAAATSSPIDESIIIHDVEDDMKTKRHKHKKHKHRSKSRDSGNEKYSQNDYANGCDEERRNRDRSAETIDSTFRHRSHSRDKSKKKKKHKDKDREKGESEKHKHKKHKRRKSIEMTSQTDSTDYKNDENEFKDAISDMNSKSLKLNARDTKDPTEEDIKPIERKTDHDKSCNTSLTSLDNEMEVETPVCTSDTLEESQPSNGHNYSIEEQDMTENKPNKLDQISRDNVKHEKDTPSTSSVENKVEYALIEINIEDTSIQTSTVSTNNIDDSFNDRVESGIEFTNKDDCADESLTEKVIEKMNSSDSEICDSSNLTETAMEIEPVDKEVENIEREITETQENEPNAQMRTLISMNDKNVEQYKDNELEIENRETSSRTVDASVSPNNDALNETIANNVKEVNPCKSIDGISKEVAAEENTKDSVQNCKANKIITNGISDTDLNMERNDSLNTEENAKPETNEEEIQGANDKTIDNEQEAHDIKTIISSAKDNISKEPADYKSTYADTGEADGDDWDALFDDSGEALDPSLMEELTIAVGKVKVQKPQFDYYNYTPTDTDLDYDMYGHLIEIYEFPEEFQTRDLMHIFKDYLDHGFDIKWVDDTHAIGVFSSVIAANTAMRLQHPMLKVRPIFDATPQTKRKAKKSTEFLQPYKERPETSASTARRLVSGALGIGTKMSREKRAEERQKLKEARDKKKQANRAKKDAWDGSIGRCAMDDV